MTKDKSKKIISTNSGDSSKKSSTKKIVETSGSKKSNKKKIKIRKKSADTSLDSQMTRSSRSSRSAAVPQELLFNRNNYIFIAGAFGLIVLGMLLMMGGEMPDSNTWDESIIYSTRRTLIAPIVILMGLIMGVFAIFRD